MRVVVNRFISQHFGVIRNFAWNVAHRILVDQEPLSIRRTLTIVANVLPFERKIAQVVATDIHHHVHPAIMRSFNQFFQSFFRTEIFVDLKKVNRIKFVS